MGLRLTGVECLLQCTIFLPFFPPGAHKREKALWLEAINQNANWTILFPNSQEQRRPREGFCEQWRRIQCPTENAVLTPVHYSLRHSTRQVFSGFSPGTC